MSLVLTMGIVLTLVLLSVLGVRRGVQRGMLTLAGTLMAAVLVELWQDRWAQWLREQFRPEDPASLTLWAVMTGFVGVALLVGYGSGFLLPRPTTPHQNRDLRDLVLGGLIGALNGALIISYLLRYAANLSSEFQPIMQEMTLARLLHNWLPWFVLTIVLLVGGLVLVRAVMRGIQLLNRPPAASPATPSNGAVAGPTQIAGAKTDAERLQAVSNKIEQRMGNQRK